MEKINQEKVSGPWYRNYRYWSELALDYIRSYKNLPKEAIHHAEFKAFSQFMGYRLVFESNLIEGEGLSSGETKRVVKEFFPSIPDNYDEIRQLASIEKEIMSDFENPNKLKEIMNIIEKYGLEKEKIIPSIKFANKSRGYIEVIQHYQAYLLAEIITLKFEAKRYRDVFKEILKLMRDKQKDNKAKELEGSIKRWINEIKDSDHFFTEDRIKELHKVMARGIMPKDAMVKSGQYRIDERMVGDFGVAFPAPEIVPKCMEEFIENANALILSAWKNERDKFEVAALISHGFVRIHPFPDFNGRVSRLILMIVLRTYGVPFAVTLRGDKRGRNRYLSSLRKANNNYITPYAALIAMRVVELFREINENVLLAGLPSILSFKP